MIYLLFICFLAIYIPARYRLYKVKKHDGILFPLCQLRRDIMGFLYENYKHKNVLEKRDIEKLGTLSHEEYKSIRRLMDALDVAIHNYNNHKTVMFNMRKMAKHVRQYRRTLKLKQTDVLELTNRPEIQMFHSRFALCLAKAFLAYTPLLRWELALKLVALAYRVGHSATSKHLRRYLLASAKGVRDTAHGDSDVRGLVT